MRIRKSTWFEVTSRYTRNTEDGYERRTTETDVVEAASFNEAEVRITAQYANINNDFEVARMRRAPYVYVLITDSVEDAYFYVATVDFADTDEEDGEKKKRKKVKYLIQAATIEQAHGQIREYLNSLLAENATVGVMKTRVVSVLEKAKDEKPQDDGSEQ